MKKIERVLSNLARELNGNGVVWALGGSLMLHYEGYEVEVNDIDILVDNRSHEALLKTINDYPYIYINSDEKYQTEHFYSLTIDGIDIDIMVNFKVKTKAGLYEFPFNKSKITKEIQIQNETICLSSVEEWFKAYKAMNRTDKVDIIQQKNHFN